MPKPKTRKKRKNNSPPQATNVRIHVRDMHVRRAMHGKAGAAFRSWVALIEERAQMMHVFRYAMNANLGRAWRCWEECVEERHRL